MIRIVGMGAAFCIMLALHVERVHAKMHEQTTSESHNIFFGIMAALVLIFHLFLRRSRTDLKRACLLALNSHGHHIAGAPACYTDCRYVISKT